MLEAAPVAAFVRPHLRVSHGLHLWSQYIEKRDIHACWLNGISCKKWTIKRPRAAGISIMHVDEKIRLMAVADTNAALFIERKA